MEHQVITLAEAIASFLRHRERQQLTRATLANYRRHVTTWQDWRAKRGLSPNLADVQLADLQGFMEEINGKVHSAHTAASYWRDLRGLWNFLQGEGLLTTEQIQFFANRRMPRPRLPDHEPRPYCDEDKLSELLAACGEEHSEAGARDRAILAMLFETGLRVSELASLTDEAVDLRYRRAQVVGKGGKWAYVFWGPRAAALLLRYLRVRRGKRGGALFRGVSWKNNGGPISGNVVRLMMRRLGVELPKGAPVHFLRHGFAHKAIDAGLDLSQVQQLMRHSSPQTTMLYLKERPERLQDLHRRVYGTKRPGQVNP